MLIFYHSLRILTNLPIVLEFPSDSLFYIIATIPANFEKISIFYESWKEILIIDRIYVLIGEFINCEDVKY